jgi:hypothetical protein
MFIMTADFYALNNYYLLPKQAIWSNRCPSCESLDP